MKSIEKTIKKTKMFIKGDNVAVAVSGGVDSMCLLDYLNKNRENLGINLSAITINHNLRPEAKTEIAMVKKYCEENSIPLIVKSAQVKERAEEEKLTIEEAGRIARKEIFEGIIKQNGINKVAIAHHKQDQVETILMNLFRGCGLTGASGMKEIRGNFVRPMLNTEKMEILAYQMNNNIPYMEDASNFDDAYSRNYLRNKILPELKTKWPNIETNIVNFSKVCKEDNAYIESTINFDDIIKRENSVSIPLFYFVYPEAIVVRVMKYALGLIDKNKDMERKHFKMLKAMAMEAENGVKITLPNNVIAHKEYDTLTLVVKKEKKRMKPTPLQSGTLKVEDFGTIIVKKVKLPTKTNSKHIIDARKIPLDAVWRFRQEGDMFKKLGAGTKKLKDYFIDEKIPSRLRDSIPVLVKNHEVFVVANYDISENVKIDENSKMAYTIEYKA